MFSAHSPRVSRALSAFDHASNRWAALPLRNPNDPITQKPSSPRAVGKQTLSLISWNIQASGWKHVARSELILDHILKGPKIPDIIFFQEVASIVRRSILNDPRVRSSFLTTDAEDDTSFKGKPFATMTLLSSKRFVSPLLVKEEKDDGEGGSKMVLDSVFRMELPSKFKRDALCVNIAAPAAPGQVLRLFNVHLDSLSASLRRLVQMSVLADALREPGCSGGIIAGDFNAIYPDDHDLIDKHNLVDAWVALHGSRTGSDGGATWGVGVELEGGLKPGRLDKVVMLGLQPNEIEVLQPGRIGLHTPWSDHCGLCCTFTI